MNNQPITPATPPRIVALIGAAYPSARIDSVDAANGIAVFAYLDANCAQVDSGGSIARFAPLAALPPAPDAEPDVAPVYPEVPDATLADAIANPAPEPVAVPVSVRSAALRYVLNGAGLRSAVETAIAAADQNAKDAWEFEVNFRRDHPLVSALGGALGLTAAQIDALFVSAAQL